MSSPLDTATENERQPTQTFPENDTPTWTWQDTLRGALLTLAPLLVIAIVSLLIPSSQQGPSRRLSFSADLTSALLTLFLQALLEGVFLIAPFWFIYLKPRRLAQQRHLPLPTFREALRSLGFRNVRPGFALAAVVAGIIAINLVGIVYTLIARAFNIAVATNVDTVLKEAATAPYTTLAILIGAVLFAPACEEIFFRSYFFQGLRWRMHVWLAAVLSTVLWGLIHGDLGSLLLLIAIGLILAFLRWRARSIWPSIALHTLNNLISAIVVLQAIHF